MRIYILAGSDSRPGPVPDALDASMMLRGCKGAISLPAGHCLLQELILRIRASGLFVDPVVVGPQEVYNDLVDAKIVDVTGSLADTLSVLRDELYQNADLDEPVAFIACDILPSVEEIRSIIQEGYESHSDSCLWGQLVQAEPESMGASSWKPRYHFQSEDGKEPLTLFPGHLVVARPSALRLRLTNHLLQLAYRHRNLNLRRRPIPMVFKGLGRLIREDVRNLFRGQLPILTLSIPWYCLTAFRKFQSGRLTVSGFSRSVMKVLLHRDRQKSDPPSVVFFLSKACSFAKDIDTQIELDEVIALMNDSQSRADRGNACTSGNL